jgi:hypothetical protein
MYGAQTACQTLTVCRGHLKCVGTRTETRFRRSAKRTSPFKSAGASVQSTTGSRCVCISGSNAVYTMFRGSVKSTGYPLHSQVSPSLPLPASRCAITFQLEFTTSSNIQKFCVLPTVHLCVLCRSQNKERSFPYTTLSHRFL